MLRIALLGCGKIAKKHIQAIEKIPEASIVSVCDKSDALLKECSELLAVPGYSCFHSMLSNENIDMVHILTPSGLHAQHALEVLEYGKHVVIEKPMALTIGDAEAMIEKADKKRSKIFVVKQYRCTPTVALLKQAITEGAMGKLVMGTVRVRWCRDQNYYDQHAWRGTWKYDGGVLTNQAIHHIDALRWLLGDVETVFAMTATQLVDIEADDTAVATLKFKSGALGIIEATTAARPADLEGSISILGEKGSVVLGGFSANKIDHWKFADAKFDQMAQGLMNKKPDYYYSHYAFIKNAVQSVLTDSAALVDGFEGMKTLRLLHGIYESAETAQPVSLYFRPKRSHLGLATRPLHESKTVVECA